MKLKNTILSNFKNCEKTQNSNGNESQGSKCVEI